MTKKLKSRKEKTHKLSLERQAETLPKDEEHLSFSFKYLNTNVSVKRCDNIVFRKFTERLIALSKLTWAQIKASPRHQYGWEPINRKSLKPNQSIPNQLSDKDVFYVFRYDSDNHAFVGLRDKDVLYPVFIEAAFGDIYDHGQ